MLKKLAAERKKIVERPVCQHFFPESYSSAANLKHASINSGWWTFFFVFEIRAFKFRCFKRSVRILNFASLYLFILLTIYLFSGAYFECTCFVNYKLSICIIPQNIFPGFFSSFFFKVTHPSALIWDEFYKVRFNQIYNYRF